MVESEVQTERAGLLMGLNPVGIPLAITQIKPLVSGNPVNKSGILNVKLSSLRLQLSMTTVQSLSRQYLGRSLDAL